MYEWNQIFFACMRYICYRIHFPIKNLIEICKIEEIFMDSQIFMGNASADRTAPPLRPLGRPAWLSHLFALCVHPGLAWRVVLLKHAVTEWNAGSWLVIQKNSESQNPIAESPWPAVPYQGSHYQPLVLFAPKKLAQSESDSHLAIPHCCGTPMSYLKRD